ncbi:KilA-N domain-containing protein [Gilliamella apicola]
MKNSRGKFGEIWFHPKLAVNFVIWISASFVVWCNLQIDKLI